MTARIKGWLASPRARWLVPVIAILLASPALTGGWAADDHLHRVLLMDDTVIDGFAPTDWDLFEFASGDPERMKRLMDRGVFPWTTDPELRLAFARPLSALTHRLDHALWPDSEVAAVAHNLAWFALLLWVLGALYRRIHATPWVAGIALAMYAFDDLHGPTFSWIANRQAMISAVFGLAALIVHDRWRRGGWRPGVWVGPVLLLLALGAGESSLAVTGYLFAYTLFIDPRRSPRQFLVGLGPYVAVAVAWLIAYRAGGYGAHHSGAYIDPGADPLKFASQAADYVPVLLTSQLAGVWSDFYAVLPEATARTFWIGCLVYLLLVLDVLKVTLARVAEARFWATGMIIAAIPISSTIPADRLLIFVGVGAMGLVACFFEAPEGEPGKSASSRVRRFSVKTWTVGFVLAHLIAGPLLMPIRARSMHTVGGSLERSSQSLPMDTSVADKTVVAVNPPADPYMAFVPLMRASLGQPIPGRQRWLAVGQTAVSVLREDPRTLRVAPDGGYLQLVSERLVRHPERSFRAGQRVELAGVTVEVVELTADGRPAETRWRFSHPLSDARFVWVRWSDEAVGWVSWMPPKVGERVTLPAVDGVRAFLGPD